MPKPTIGFKTPEAELIEALKAENAQLKIEQVEAKKALLKANKANRKLQARIVELEEGNCAPIPNVKLERFQAARREANRIRMATSRI